MARAFERTLVGVGALSIAAGGAVLLLRGDDAPAGRVVDRRDVVVDKSYRIELRAPGPQWEVLDRAEASAISPGWLASMISADLRLDVMAEAIGDLGVVEGMKVVNERLPQYEETERRDLEWQGQPALEVALVFVFEDGRRHEKLARAFVHQRLLYRVTLSRMADAGDPWPHDIDAIWNAFTLLPGTVEPTPLVVPPRFTRGQGWQIDENGRFASHASGIVVTPPQGWQIGVDTDDESTDIEIQLANDALDCTVAYWVDDEVTRAAPPTGEQVFVAPVLGTPVQFVELAGPAYTTWLADMPLGDRELHVEGWCPKQVTAAPAALRELWGAVSTMDPAERERQAEAGRHAVNAQVTIDADHSMRHGRYVNYEHDLVWQLPVGDAWRVVTAPVNDAIAWAIEQRRGLIIELSLGEPVGTNVELRRSMTHEGFEHVRVVPSSDRPAVAGQWDDGGVLRETRIEVMSRRGRDPIRILVSGRADAMAAAAGEIAGWIAGVSNEAIEPDQVRDGRLLDHRMGYTFAIPDDEWDLDSERGGMWGDETRRIWQREDADWMGVYAAYKPGSLPSDREVQFDVRAAVSQLVSDGKAPRPRSSPIRVAGRDGIKLSWREGATPVSLALFERDQVIYTLFAYGEGVRLSDVIARFAFPD
jgi:hypothetical protein